MRFQPFYLTIERQYLHRHLYRKRNQPSHTTPETCTTMFKVLCPRCRCPGYPYIPRNPNSHPAPKYAPSCTKLGLVNTATIHPLEMTRPLETPPQSARICSVTAFAVKLTEPNKATDVQCTRTTPRKPHFHPLHDFASSRILRCTQL